jgi:hypothetical protein
VPFAPLDAEAILKVARRELELIKRRDGVLARQVKLSVEEETLAWIAAQGCDEKYGARPLKRAFEKHLLVPLAEAVNAYDGALLLQASAGCAGDRLKVSVKPQINAHGYPIQVHATGNAAEALALACGSIRREVSRLKKGTAYSEVSNLAYYLQRLSKRQRQDPAYRGDTPATRFCLADYESLLKQTSELETKVCETEDKHLLSAYGQGEEPKVTVACLKTEWQELLLRYLELTWPHPTGQVCLGVYSRHIELMREIVRAYMEAARVRGAQIKCLALEPSPPKSSGGRPIRSIPLRKEDNLEDFTRLIGVVVEVTGRMSHPYFAPERGKQVVLNQGEKEKQLRSFLVDVSTSSMEQYQPPAGVEFPKVGEEHSVIRRFDAIQQQVNDVRLGRLSWPDLSLGGMIRKILDQLHEKALEALMSE